MSPNDEMNLLRRVQAGDEDALLTLHAQYANLVYSVAYRVLNDQMAAEEVTQDTFMRLWNKSYTYDPQKGRFITWLLTVTRRLAIDHYRQRLRREPQTGLLFMDEDPSLWENVLTAAPPQPPPKGPPAVPAEPVRPFFFCRHPQPEYAETPPYPARHSENAHPFRHAKAAQRVGYGSAYKSESGRGVVMKDSFLQQITV